MSCHARAVTDRCVVTCIIASFVDLVWWNSLTPVDQASQANIDILVSVTEQIKLAEVSAWADASRRKEEGEGTGVSDDSVTVGEQNSRPTNKNVVHPEP